jgi:hypothetical protein
MIMWRMRIACWITKATNTLTEYVSDNYCFFTAAVVARTCPNVTLSFCLLVSLYIPVASSLDILHSL